MLAGFGVGPNRNLFKFGFNGSDISVHQILQHAQLLGIQTLALLAEPVATQQGHLMTEFFLADPVTLDSLIAGSDDLIFGCQGGDVLLNDEVA